MAKVIVERPRRAGVTVKGVGRVRDIEDLPRNQGMTRPHRMNWGGKELNENLAPLRRFLHSRVGQKWDAVYSEISENLRVSSTVQAHVRDHVTDFVAVNCSMRDGEVWVHGYGVRTLQSSRDEMYVDPEDGVLKLNPHYMSWNQIRRNQDAAHKAGMEANQRCVAGVELRKHKGIWYEVQMLPVPDVQKVAHTRMDGTVWHSEVGGSAYDVIQERTVYLAMPGRRYHSGPYVHTYCASKRQLNRNELKKYGVCND